MLQSWLEGAGTTEPLFCYVIRLHYYLRTFTRSRYNTKLFDYETQNHPKANISWEKEHTFNIQTIDKPSTSLSVSPRKGDREVIKEATEIYILFETRW